MEEYWSTIGLLLGRTRCHGWLASWTGWPLKFPSEFESPLPQVEPGSSANYPLSVPNTFHVLLFLFYSILYKYAFDNLYTLFNSDRGPSSMLRIPRSPSKRAPRRCVQPSATHRGAGFPITDAGRPKSSSQVKTRKKELVKNAS